MSDGSEPPRHRWGRRTLWREGRVRTPSGGSMTVAERPKVGVGVMLRRGSDMLLGKRLRSHGAGSYGWCGGHVEFGETLEEAAAREVAEESGLKVHGLRLLCVSNVREYGRHYIDIEFIAEDFEGTPAVREPDRLESWDWYRLDALPSPLFLPVRLALDSYRTGQMYNP
ncbi:NUDIX domain-containing protein [Streptomyces griseoluteus]|uniref:NUDIX domain-containing protein n=1 Tax=Streptomyces griseoluteus TaxID=29306 RepID=A0A4Z1DJ35_STRGP|nr:NUDIX domain-containing protein [Streptomyces griseoluteus]TGN83833.1 NUDIX domain-containing protein [Streptomyces griseoluteus]